MDYFDELLARIRKIRASEARVYQRNLRVETLQRPSNDWKSSIAKGLSVCVTLRSLHRRRASGVRSKAWFCESPDPCSTITEFRHFLFG